MFCPSEKLHPVVRRWLNAFQYRLAFSSFVFHLQYFLHLFSTTFLLLKCIFNSIPHRSMIMWFGNCTADSLLSHVLHPGRLTTPLESGRAKSTFNMRSWLLTSFFLPSEIVKVLNEPFFQIFLTHVHDSMLFYLIFEEKKLHTLNNSRALVVWICR